MSEAVQLDPVDAADEEQIQWATFKLLDEVYGIHVMQVKEVQRLTEIAPVPGAQHYVLGIVNLRGNVITVLDTRTLFGLPRGEVTDQSRIIVIEMEDQYIGILVDEVADVIYLKRSAIERAPNVGTDESAKFIQGVSYYNEQLITLLDFERIIEDSNNAL